MNLDQPFRSVGGVERGLTELLDSYVQQKDRRGIFAGAYLEITRAVGKAIAAGEFEDNAWAERYLVTFANYYRKALQAQDAGRPVPKPWRIAFDAAAAESALTLQDLMLGVNAHINYDLAQALYDTGIDPDRKRAYRDHTAVNNVLRAATDPLQDRVYRTYAPALEGLDEAGGRLDEKLANFAVEKAREAAWNGAVALTNARTSLERGAYRRLLEESAGVLARLIQVPALPAPVVKKLQTLERKTPWWTYLFTP